MFLYNKLYNAPCGCLNECLYNKKGAPHWRSFMLLKDLMRGLC